MSVPILLVDDNPVACASEARLLWDLGYQVDVAFNRFEAIDLADKKDYGLAIIDDQMHGTNGVELFRHLREFRHDLIGIILTGKHTKHFIYPGIEPGVLSVLAKPVNFCELLPIIQECVAPGPWTGSLRNVDAEIPIP